MIDEHKNMKLKLNSFIASKSVQLSQTKNKTSSWFILSILSSISFSSNVFRNNVTSSNT